MKKNHFKFILFWTIAIVSFVVIGGYLIISAGGYRVDYSNWTFQKTSLISIRTQPSGAHVYVNGKLKPETTPLNLSRLLPGWYDIEIKKADYLPWSRTIDIDGGIVDNLNHIALFLKEPKIKDGNQEDTDILNNLTSPGDLQIKDYSINRISNGRPITVVNLSQLVKSAYWYSDHWHVAYQVGNEIYISEIDGRSAQLLLKLDSDEPTKIAFKDDGKTMLVGQNGKVYEVTIR